MASDSAESVKRRDRDASPAPVARRAAKEPQSSGNSVAAKAAPKMQRQHSIYALTPDQRWLWPSLAFPLYAGTLASTMLVCLVWQPSYKMLRLQYTLVGVALLMYRVYYYARKEWILYFIDLCFVNSILLIVSLWCCSEGECSQEWLLAVYLVAQGPVAGAIFPLQTPLTLYHPEAFESFFLHASPMWISYAVRWRWGGLGEMPTVGSLMILGFRRIYLPWSLLYLVFLLSQPIFPDKIAGYETLVDGLILPSAKSAEQRLVAKRQDYAAYAKKVLFAVGLHCVLSGSGFLAASLAYQYHEVQVVWIACVFLSCLSSGARFYYQSAVPEYEPPGLYKGFMNMALAWAFVVPTYCYAAGYVKFR